MHLRAVRSRIRSDLRRMAARRSDPEGLKLAKKIRAHRLTFLEIGALLDLRDRAKQIDAEQIPGVIVEAGCALGGSAIMLAGSKSRSRALEVYDVFGMIPPPSRQDGQDVQARFEAIARGKAKGFAGDTYYGYQADLKRKVADSFAKLGVPPGEHAVTLVEGLFEDTIRPAGPIALAHIDGDWYESVKVCLDRIWPALSPGGVMVIDDYDAWSGCRTAVDEFVAEHPDCRIERRSRLHLVRPARI
jgi:asparagine synthase (glutamine-hydrolysing)